MEAGGGGGVGDGAEAGLTVAKRRGHGRRMSSSSASSGQGRSRLWLKLAVLAVVGAAGVWLVLRGVDVRGLFDRGAAWLRGLGPGPYFLALTVLPAVGFPISAFTLSVGPVFGPTLGIPLVLLLTGVAVALNLALSYWLARYALRPWVARLLRWLGYTLPEVSAKNQWGLTVLVRVTPGPPYFVQGCVLGLVAMPFGVYMTVSWLVTMAYAVGLVFFGDSLAKGNGGAAVGAAALVAVVVAGVMILRRRLAARERREAEKEAAAGREGGV